NARSLSFDGSILANSGTRRSSSTSSFRLISGSPSSSSCWRQHFPETPWLILQIGERPELHDPPVFHYQDHVETLTIRGALQGPYQTGLASRTDNGLDHHVVTARIERCGRLGQQQPVRILHQSTCNGQFLPLCGVQAGAGNSHLELHADLDDRLAQPQLLDDISDDPADLLLRLRLPVGHAPEQDIVDNAGRDGKRLRIEESDCVPARRRQGPGENLARPENCLPLLFIEMPET